MSAIKRGIGRSASGSRFKEKDSNTWSSTRQNRFDNAKSGTTSRLPYRETRYDSYDSPRSSGPKREWQSRGRGTAPSSSNRFAVTQRYNDEETSQQDTRRPKPFHKPPLIPSARIRNSRSESEPQSSSNRLTRNTFVDRGSSDGGKQLRIGIPGEKQSERHSTKYSRNVNQFNIVDNKDGRKDVLEEVSFRPRISKNSVKILRTTAASDFIYGKSSVLAALKAASRRFYNLYLTRSSEDEKSSFEDLYKYALNNGVNVVWLNGPEELSEMDRVTKGRPHNGVILEASPLPKLPISALGKAQRGISFQVELRHQSREEEQVNGSISQIPVESTSTRYPFVILLDEIVDQGNLGGILRSAYFLGADAVVLSSHMALMNAVTLKAASGAAEGIRLLSVQNTTGFLETSKQNGWKVFASVAPPTGKHNHKSNHLEVDSLGYPLQDAPCILLIGGEGEGLRRDLILKADHTISITGQRSRQSGVDSLNVSVAAGILMDAFLKEPVNTTSKAQEFNGPETSNSSNLLF